MYKTVPTDSDLLNQMAEGNEYALRTLYDRYWNKIYGYTIGKVGNQDTAEDIVQDIFIELWNRREDIMIERLEPYLYTAAKNQIINVIRKGIIRRHHEDSSYSAYLSVVRNLDIEEDIAYKELRAAIQEGLEFLPDKTREIFRLNRLDELSAREVSILLDIPLRTVEYHIAHALRTMKVHLREYFMLVFGLLNIISKSL
jgi:RNA polymerase sigma-70 factor (family 1)